MIDLDLWFYLSWIEFDVYGISPLSTSQFVYFEFVGDIMLAKAETSALLILDNHNISNESSQDR